MIEREQYYFDTIKPEYNILQIAGSTLGRKYSEKALDKPKKSEIFFEHIVKLKKHLAKNNSSIEQRSKARARMLKINKNK